LDITELAADPTLTINQQLSTVNGETASTPILVLNNLSYDKIINFVLASAASMFNPTNVLGDSVIYAAGGVVNTGILNLTTWSATAVGVRITSTDVTISGSTTNLNSSLTYFNNLTGNTSATVTATSFKSTSDYRIKENVKPLDDTFTVDNLRPVIYTLKDTKQQGLGIIAHELQEEYPFMVTGEKDGDETQSVNYTYLIGILIKEVQDLKKTVSIMKTQIRDLQDNQY
jgi:hypothetical protein